MHLEFSEYETNEPVRFLTIPGFSHARIRATCKPAELGRFESTICIENLCNDDNSVPVSVVVISSAKGTSMAVCSDVCDGGLVARLPFLKFTCFLTCC